MTDLPARRNSRLKKREPKSEEEELMELDEELLTKRGPLDFHSYQREVMLNTSPHWPIPDPDEVLRKIIYAARSAEGADKHKLVVQMARILRSVAELCDYIPISMERVAHISLSVLPEDGPELGTQSDEVKKLS